NLRPARDTIGPKVQSRISVKTTNSGETRGDVVAQLYIRYQVRSVTRPVKELRGFQRIRLDPGQSHTVEFMLGPKQLSFLDHEMQRVVEPGTFKIMVGGSSVDVIETKLNVVAK